MARQYQAARRKPGISSITYWRKFAQHRLIYLMLAAIFGFGMVAYFGTGGPMGSANQRTVREQDAIVTVNGEPVTQGEFENEWSQMKRFFSSNDAQAAQFQGSTLSRLIQSALASSIARQKGLTVSDADIDQAISEQKKAGGKPIPDSDWQKMLDAQGISERDLRDQLRTSLLPAALFQSYKNQVKVTDDELLKTYDQAKARKILIMRLPEAQAKNKLEKIRDDIKKGADFAAMANKFSEDPQNKSQFPDPKTKKMVQGAPKGGDMGWVQLTAGTLDPAEIEALKKLKAGDISNVIRTPGGSEIIKVEQTKRDVPPDFAKNKTKLIDDYKATQARTPFTKFMEEQQKKAKIVWQDQSMKWRYDYAQSSPMGGAPVTGDAIKKQAEIKQELRDYTAKNKTGDGAAALVLARNFLEQEYVLSKGPRHDELRAELIKLYDQGLKNVEDSQARMRLAQLYTEAGKPQDALAQYERQQKLLSWDQTPGSKFLHTQLETAFKKLGKPDLAEKETRKIAQLTAEEKKAEEARKKQEAERKKAEDEARKKAAANPAKPGAATANKDAVIAPGGTMSITPGITTQKQQPAKNK